MVIRSLLICTLLLTGCAHNKVKPDPVVIVKTQEVEKPVFACPSEVKSLQKPSRPNLAIDLLNEEDSKDPGKVVKYYKVTVKQLMNYATDLEKVTEIHETACAGLPSVIVPSE
jgi:hypothetical protein